MLNNLITILNKRRNIGVVTPNILIFGNANLSNNLIKTLNM